MFIKLPRPSRSDALALRAYPRRFRVGIIIVSLLVLLGGLTVAFVSHARAAGSVTVSLTSSLNNKGIGAAAGQGNFDGASYAYAASQVPVGGAVTLGGVAYQFPSNAAGTNDNVVAQGQMITLPQGQFQSLSLLAASSFGPASGVVKVAYTDATSTSATLTVPDWYNADPASVVTSTFRYTPTGTDQHAVYIFALSLSLDTAKTVSTLTLPSTSGNTEFHLFAATLLPATTARNFYVATSGSDNNAGTLQSPFATIARAQAAVRQALTAGTGPITVYVEGGTYYLGQTLTFGAQDSGTTASPVTYTNYQGQGVTLSGGQRLTPTWSTYSGNIHMATIGQVPSFDQLFLNGQQQVLARYPNYDPNTAILNGYSNESTVFARIAGYKNPTTADIRAEHCSQWGGEDYRVTGVSGGTPQLQWVGDNNRGNCINTNQMIVENAFEELDAPDEWFYDRPNGKLYFYPPAGTNLATATIETAALDELIHVEGTSSSAPVRDLTFAGFTFTEAHRSLFDSTYEGLQMGDWAVARKGAVHLKNAENITVSHSSFNQLGGNGVFIDGYNSNDLITQNQFAGDGATDVQVVGSAAASRNKSTWAKPITTLTDTTAGPLTNDYPNNITISYNQMYNMGRFELESAGVNISIAHNVDVAYNTIHHSPRSCVNINDGTFGGDIIEHNDIFDCVNSTGDHGPINSWGRDRWWSLTGYTDAQLKQYSTLDQINPNIIRDNRIWHNNSWDIDLDDGSSNYQIYDNLLLNAGVKLRDGFTRAVTNDILVNGSLYEQVSHASDGDVLKNNIILNANPYQLTNSDPAKALYAVDNNLFWNNGNAVALPSGWTTTDGLDTHSKTADPQFVNGSPWNNPSLLDYTVGSGSPALTLGFTNFPMNQFGDPGSPTPPAITWPSGSGGLTSVDQQPEYLMGATDTAIYSTAIESSVGLGDMNGVYLQTVPSGSYAQQHGFLTADVIRAINGATVTNRQSFWTVYDTLAPGSTVTTSVWRNQAATTVTFTKISGTEELNDTSGMVYTGSGWAWKNAQSGGTGNLLNDIYATQHIGDSFSFTFNGTGIDMITEKYSDEGQVDMYIDGTLKQTIDCTNVGRLYQQTVYSIAGLTAGQHTIKGVMKTGSYLLVDAFTVHS